MAEDRSVAENAAVDHVVAKVRVGDVGKGEGEGGGDGKGEGSTYHSAMANMEAAKAEVRSRA